MGERYVFIRGKTFLYREKAPFVTSGVSTKGALELDLEQDEIRCHECGRWFKRLARHIVKAHGMTARGYKTKHGLEQKSALINEGLRLRLSQAGTARVRSDPDFIRRFIAARRSSWKRGPGKEPKFEARNARNTCDAQLLAKVRQLACRLGETPSVRQMQEHGLSLRSLYFRLNVRSVGSLMTLAGLAEPHRPAQQPRYLPDAVLIERILDFYATHRRLPSESDCRRGLLPSYSTLYKRFGGMKAALEAAGLGKVAMAS